MAKRLTITLDDIVYQGLFRKAGPRGISKFLEKLIRPHVVDTALEDAYREMAADEDRESEAMEWTENLVGDLVDETR